MKSSIMKRNLLTCLFMPQVKSPGITWRCTREKEGFVVGHTFLHVLA